MDSPLKVLYMSADLQRSASCGFSRQLLTKRKYSHPRQVLSAWLPLSVGCVELNAT